MKGRILFSLFMVSIFVFAFSSTSFGEPPRDYRPVSVMITNSGTLYIMMANNIGAQGCTHNRNSVILLPTEHSVEYIKSSLAIALSAIASGQRLTVYWSGCLSGGRPNAAGIQLGTVQPN